VVASKLSNPSFITPRVYPRARTRGPVVGHWRRRVAFVGEIVERDAGTVGTAPRIERVVTATREEFVAYALEHGAEHDESFANAEDLREFDPVFEPAALAKDAVGAVIGAASLMVKGYAQEGLARFRVLHALDAEVYPALAEAVLSAAPTGAREAYLFVPHDAPVRTAFERMGFRPTRYAIVLRREGSEPPPLEPAEGTVIAQASPDLDARAWADVSNAAFGGFPGRYDITEAQAKRHLAEDRLLPGGALLMWRSAEPVGLVAVSRDPMGREFAFIDQLAVVPALQGRGIGRTLLRAAVRVAFAAGLDVVELSTNETNERARGLYTSEGFEVTERVVCLTRDLSRDV
jgi:mycothiol synthase